MMATAAKLSPDYFPLPITVEEVTANWLTTALRTRAPGVTVLKAEVVDTIFTTCSKIRMRLTMDEAGKKAGIPELIIIKGGFEAHGRELSQMHEREVRGYRDIYPVLPLPHPTCYFAEYDADRRQGIIIMDDLVAGGAEFCSALRPQTHEQVALRLSMLAKFHAGSWDSADIKPGGKWSDLVNFFDVMKPFFDKYSSEENWERLIALPRGVAVSKRFHSRQWMVESWEKMVNYSRSLPHCIIHGDMHLGNLYIAKDGTPGFLDTLASLAPAMLEVSYHITGALDLADRARWEGALVRHYLDEVARHGGTPPSFDEAMHQYGIFLVYGLFIWATTESRFQPEAVNTANSARVSSALLDHDTLGLIRAL